MHDHHHPHPKQPDSDVNMTYHQRLETAVYELLLDKGVFSGDDVRRTVERIDAQTSAIGARVVARAWVDPAYRARLLADGSKAVEELGVNLEGVKLVVVENTPQVHNLIVCTLCSCYPRPLLGLPPDWYKSRNYRSRTVREPRSVLAEFGTRLPDSVTVHVHDSTADMRYMVLPMRPEGTESLSEEELAQLVTRDSMIGVIQVRTPQTVSA
jgi:nitrile hydratase